MPCPYQAAAGRNGLVAVALLLRCSRATGKQGDDQLTHSEESLQEQLEPELIVLRRGEPSVYQVVEPDEEATSVGTQGGADDGAREPTNKRAEDEWADARAGRPLGGRCCRIYRRTGIGWLVNVSQHLLTLPKPRRGSPSTH
jgi:hypothetical protein